MEPPQDVLEIVEQHLEQNGYDGLFYDGECACKVGDLAPCGEINGGCEPGYLRVFQDGCGGNCSAGGGCDWHIQREKPVDNPHPTEA